MKIDLQQAFVEGCFMAAIGLVGIGLYQAIQPDNKVKNIRAERMKANQERQSVKL
jgi:hypothetical protein